MSEDQSVKPSTSSQDLSKPEDWPRVFEQHLNAADLDAVTIRPSQGIPHTVSFECSVTSMMKRAIPLLIFAFTISCQMQRNETRNELLRWEKDFAKAVVSNNADAIGKFLADDWVIIDPDGGIIDRARFLDVIKSGMLSHELMESDAVQVRSYGDCAIVTALTGTKAKFAGQEFTTQERATDVFVRRAGRWHCVFSQLTKFKAK
jgi:ketosteroid isomerase-like protein